MTETRKQLLYSLEQNKDCEECVINLTKRLKALEEAENDSKK